MSPEDHSPPSSDVLSQVRRLLGLGGARPAETPGAACGVPAIEALQRYTRRQLLEGARLLGLTGRHALTKDALVARLEGALRTLGVLQAREPEPAAARAPARRAGADAAHKFDLGRPAEPAVEPEHIPWGYGQNRVTAIVVDPARLYVYWEVTDDAIERARADLGPAGRDAWLNLRVYDVTGRIFDGTNAHGYFDHKLERGDRQWFFAIGKPTSSACVEIGMKSLEGYFVRIARSGRAEFPRREPAPAAEVEWLTVRTATGPVETPRPGGMPHAGPPGGAPPAHDGGAREWDVRRTHPGREERFGGERVEWRWDWREVVRGEWTEGGRVFEWASPVVRTTWEAGPFAFAVESPRLVEERHFGRAAVYAENGKTRVVYGPWEVIIRGIGGRAEGRVVATWEIRYSWVAAGGFERRVASGVGLRAGASELAALGASERAYLAASEVRLGGASEVYRVGASEVRFLGASERVLLGASEWRYLGASERRALGASEWAMRGASEWQALGASERHALGASELRLGGASEARPGGASEGRLGDAGGAGVAGAGDGSYPDPDEA